MRGPVTGNRGRPALRRLMAAAAWPGFALLALSAVFAAQAADSDFRDRALSPAWQQYLQQSAADLQQQQQVLQAELAALGQKKPAAAVKAKNFGLSGIGSATELQAVLSYQTVLGGWSKRTDMRKPRQRGQSAGSEPAYIPTFDNGATSTQVRWLVAYYPKATPAEQAQIRAAVTLALQFVQKAQYPHGGFPQSYPLRGGYHDAVTLNDHVMAELLQLLWDAGHSADFSWLAPAVREEARAGFAKGVQWLLQAQVRLNGRLTVWGAQHDPLSSEPVAARKFEQVSLVSTESAALLQLLLDKAADQPGVLPALCAGIDWLVQHEIRDKTAVRDERGLRLADQPGAVTWARFYSLPDQQPVFFDRDGQTYRDVSQLSLERQQGYGWYQSSAKTLLKAWQQQPELAARCPAVHTDK